MRIAVIGAGPAGLAAAFDLSRMGHAVTIFEAGGEVGGLAAGFKAPHWDWTLEKFYHHWFQTDKHILGLIAELGWSDQVLFPRPYTVLYHRGQFYAADSIPTALAFFIRHFPILDFLRFGLVGLYLKVTPWWQPLEKVTAAAWMRRWCGPRIYNAIWQPLLVSKFGEENLGVVNMAWLWARIKARTTRLGTFAGGFQAFLDKLAGVVKAQGAEMRLNCPVTGIRQQANAVAPSGSRLALETPSDTETFDAVISTSSPALMARLAPELRPEYSDKLRGLKSMGAVVMVLALDRPLTKFYWHNLPKEAGFPFLALVEHTNFVGPEHYGGDHLIYCGDYLDPGHEYFRLGKEELLERFLPALPRFNPSFERSWVRDSWLFRTQYAQPVPPVNHSRNIPSIRTPLPGLYFASMSQVYPWDRGTNFAVEIGRKAARLVMADLSRRP